MLKSFIWLVPISVFSIWFGINLDILPLQINSALILDYIPANIPIQIPDVINLQLFMNYLSITVAIVGVLLSLMRKEPQMFMIFMTLLISSVSFNWALLYYSSTESPDLFYSLVSLWMIFVLFTFSLMSEKCNMNFLYNMMLFSWIAFPVSGIYLAITTRNVDWMALMIQPLPDTILPVEFSGLIHLPLVSVVSGLGVIAFLILRALIMKSTKTIDVVMIFVLIMILFGLNGFFTPMLLDWILFMIGVTLLLIVFQKKKPVCKNDSDDTNIKK